MKNYFIKTVVILFTIIFSYNQLWANDLRVYVGPSFSTWNVQKMGYMDPEIKFRTGFHVGAGYAITIHKNFDIEPRLVFNSKGVKVRGIYAIVDGEFDSETIYSTDIIRLNYFEIPLLLKGKYELDESKTVFLNFGPQLSIGIKGKYVNRIDGTDIKYKESFDFGDDGVKRIDFGLKTEVGFEYKSYSLAFYFDQGLINIGNSYNKTRNRSLGLTFGYKIPIKKV